MSAGIDRAASFSTAEEEGQSSSENSHHAKNNETELRSAIQPEDHEAVAAESSPLLAINQEARLVQAPHAANAGNEVLALEQPEEPAPYHMFRDSIFINEDQSEICDIVTATMVPMPADRLERMRLLAKIFDYVTTLLLFSEDEINVDKFYRSVPKALWNNSFTDAQTEMMVEAQMARLVKGIVANVRTFSRELKGVDANYPVHPNTLGEVEQAKTDEAHDARIDYFIATLTNRTPQTDMWLRQIYQAFLTTLDFSIILDPAYRFRAIIVFKIAIIADSLFVVDAERLEMLLLRREDEIRAHVRQFFGRVMDLGAPYFLPRSY